MDAGSRNNRISILCVRLPENISKAGRIHPSSLHKLTKTSEPESTPGSLELCFSSRSYDIDDDRCLLLFLGPTTNFVVVSQHHSFENHFLCSGRNLSNNSSIELHAGRLCIHLHGQECEETI